YLILLALKKDLNKIETYPNPGKNERHTNPDFSSNGQLSLRLQVVAERNTEEDDGYGYKDDSQR
ncbi:MAG: hypothetical protein JRD93_15050, partial [Deltaproteobacteria bacterium]|nr:hypothetical protein [Deltaproteobacteria bacterium]